MMERLNRLKELMPTLHRYSIVLLVYLILNDVEKKGIELKQWWIMQQTGLCQRSLQLAIRELEERKLLEREGDRNSVFILLL